MSFESVLGLVLRDELVRDLPQRAYLLATVRHECANAWRPIVERYNGDPQEYFRRYDPDTAVGKQLGNTEPGDGFRFRGRGFVQITGRANYESLSDVAGVDLVANPDAALQEDISYRILSVGCARGMFTGRKLSHYINDAGSDYINARRVINGLDKAQLIAGYARQYESLLRTIKP